MKSESIEKIAVIGAGTMGHGIAEVAALAGYQVNMRDINNQLVKKGMDAIKSSLNKMVEKELIEERLRKKITNRISTVVPLVKAVKSADFVVEAVPEKLELKKELFERLHKLTSEGAILASNTSSLPISKMASVTGRPGKVIGMHFFNPVVKMKLVEIIRGDDTSDETLQITVSLAEKMGKTPVVCKKDIRGFIVNSILIPYLNEACRIVAREEATIQEIDSAMKYRENLPMGPFELMDLIGVDVVAKVGEAIGEEVPSLIKEKLNSGELGRKSNKGFYDYQAEGVNYSRDGSEGFDTLHLVAIMVNQSAEILEKEVASVNDVGTAMKLGTGMPESPISMAHKLGIQRVVNKLRDLSDKYEHKRYRPAGWLVEKAQ